MNHLLAEKQGLKLAHPVGVDLNAAAITGERISLEKGDRVAIVFQGGASTGATVQLTLRQHDAPVSGNSKNLESDNPIYVKAGSATVFTKIVPTSKAALKDLSTQLGGAAGIAVIEVLAEELDVDGGFKYVSVDIADAGAAKLASTMYVLSNVRYAPAYAEAL
jgi:hypothetical protein